MVSTSPNTLPYFLSNIYSYMIPPHLQPYYRHVIFASQEMTVPIFGNWSSTVYFPYSNSKIVGQHGRFEEAFKYFSKNLTDCNWMLICDDDTLIRYDNLLRLVTKMKNKIIPSFDLIAKANANIEFSSIYFIGGGSGCLLSRGMVDYLLRANFSFFTYASKARYNQTDTIMTIPLRKIWKTKEWHEPAFQTYGFSNQNSIQACPADVEVVRLKDLISLHSIRSSLINIHMFTQSQTCDDNLMFFLDKYMSNNVYVGKALTLCNGSQSQLVVNYSQESIQDRLVVKYPHKMPYPLFTKKEFDALPHDNYKRNVVTELVPGLRLIVPPNITAK